MNANNKPLVATIIVVGHYYGPGFKGLEPTLFGQVRGFFNPKTGDLLKGSPGERSIFGEHFKATEDGDIVDTAVRCAQKEFWLPNNPPLTRDDFVILVEGDIETEKSVNKLFFLNKLVKPEQIGNGEGDGLLHIPLAQVPLYVRDGLLTEASLATLAYVDLDDLWQEIACGSRS